MKPHAVGDVAPISVSLLPLPLLALALLSGCDTAPSSDLSRSSRRDSAGISIVDNSAARWTGGEGWIVSAQPVLEIGEGLGSDDRKFYQFNGVQNALRLTDGRIAVADGGSRQIRIFDGSGRYVRTVGGQGEGPGEFTALSRIGSRRDGSIDAWDGNLRRLTSFGPEGSVTATTQVPSVGGMEVPATGWFADGSVVIAPSASPMEIMNLEPGGHRVPSPYLRVSPSSGMVDTLVILPGREQVVKRGEGEHAVSFQLVLFGLDGYAAVGPRSFYSGDSGAFSIEQRAPDGTLERVIRKSGAPRAVSQEELAKALAAFRDQQRKIAEQFGISVETDDPPARTAHPYFDRLLADRSGNLWVRVPGAAEEPQTWLVFDAVGTWMGSVETPAGLEVTDIGDDYVLGVTTDALDVQRVRMYASDRAPDRAE